MVNTTEAKRLTQLTKDVRDTSLSLVLSDLQKQKEKLHTSKARKRVENDVDYLINHVLKSMLPFLKRNGVEKRFWTSKEFKELQKYCTGSKIFNERTGKCVKIDGRLGKSLLLDARTKLRPGSDFSEFVDIINEAVIEDNPYVDEFSELTEQALEEPILSKKDCESIEKRIKVLFEEFGASANYTVRAIVKLAFYVFKSLAVYTGNFLVDEPVFTMLAIFLYQAYVDENHQLYPTWFKKLFKRGNFLKTFIYPLIIRLITRKIGGRKANQVTAVYSTVMQLNKGILFAMQYATEYFIEL